MCVRRVTVGGSRHRAANIDLMNFTPTHQPDHGSKHRYQVLGILFNVSKEGLNQFKIIHFYSQANCTDSLWWFEHVRGNKDSLLHWLGSSVFDGLGPALCHGGLWLWLGWPLVEFCAPYGGRFSPGLSDCCNLISEKDWDQSRRGLVDVLAS